MLYTRASIKFIRVFVCTYLAHLQIEHVRAP